MTECEEWFEMADYDFGTARELLEAKRNLHAVFLCYLALEKALKGLFQFRLKKMPPQEISLMRLAKDSEIDLPKSVEKLLLFLDEEQESLMYPNDLDAAIEQYPVERVQDIHRQTMNAFKWIRTQAGYN